MQHMISTLEHWIQLHPEYGLWITFMIAYAESLIVIGGLIPGSIAISGIGILAGSGLISIYWGFSAAAMGAFVGDISGFCIGRYFKTNLKNFFIFRYYPKTLEFGKLYFQQHGKKSVFLGRFIGPVRAIVPAVAGMMGMPLQNFICINLLSAVAWSALFYIPGVLIGKGHAQFQNHILEIVSAILLLSFPYLAIHYMPKIRLWIFKTFKTKIFNYWQSSFLARFQHEHPYFTTLTELFYLLLLLLAWSFTALYKKHILTFNNFALSKTINLSPLLLPYIHGITWLSHPYYLMFNNGIFLIGICLTQSWYLCISLGLIYLCSFLLQTFHPFVISISIQYLGLRLINSQKHRFNLMLNLFVITLWNLSSLTLSIHDQHEWLPNLLIGLLIGQISWLHARRFLRRP